jgi:hypothetical protein
VAGLNDEEGTVCVVGFCVLKIRPHGLKVPSACAGARLYARKIGVHRTPYEKEPAFGRDLRWVEMTVGAGMTIF